MNFSNLFKIFLIAGPSFFLFTFVLMRDLHNVEKSQQPDEFSPVISLSSLLKRDSPPDVIVRDDGVKRVAVLVQAHQLDNDLIREDIMQCIENVKKAKDLSDSFGKVEWEGVTPPVQFTYDVFMTYPATSTLFPIIRKQLEEMGAGHIYGQPIEINEGMDVKQFLNQLLTADTLQLNHGIEYDYFLKIHTKSEPYWRREMLNALCGSPANVLSVLKSFAGSDNERYGIVIPRGFVIQRSRGSEALFRPLRKFIGNDVEQCFRGDIDNMKMLYRIMYNKELDPGADFVFSAGTMFWATFRDFRIRDWLFILPWMVTRWSAVYKADALLEHAMERLLISIPYLNGVAVGEIAPAIRPIAIYQPTFHKLAAKKALNGKGYDGWKDIKSIEGKDILKPSESKRDGLGYYDLTDNNVRRRQGELAKAAGIEGFMIYHYWSASEGTSRYTNVLMGKVVDAMLDDGHPDLPFFFCWKNVPLVHETEDAGPDGDGVTQEYGEESQWEEHFYHLLPYFKHPRYIRDNDRPIFTFYRVGDMGDLFGKMVMMWRELAVSNGLAGLYILYAINDYVQKDELFTSDKIVRFADASFQLYPSIQNVHPDRITNTTGYFDIPTPTEHNQYWGGSTAISMNRTSSALAAPPHKFKEDLRYTQLKMLEDVTLTARQHNVPNYFFINAWNDWGEQAALEPSEQYGFKYLGALKDTLENQPLLRVP